MKRFYLLLMLGLLPVRLGAQDTSLLETAERARQAWMAHRAAELIAGSPRVLIQLPGADPSVALGPAQATALLTEFVAPAEEVEVLVRAARRVETSRGYVELQRQYRVSGTQDVRTQVLLLGYRLGGTGWALIEFRVIG